MSSTDYSSDEALSIDVNDFGDVFGSVNQNRPAMHVPPAQEAAANVENQEDTDFDSDASFIVDDETCAKFMNLRNPKQQPSHQAPQVSPQAPQVNPQASQVSHQAPQVSHQAQPSSQILQPSQFSQSNQQRPVNNGNGDSLDEEWTKQVDEISENFARIGPFVPRNPLFSAQHSTPIAKNPPKRRIVTEVITLYSTDEDTPKPSANNPVSSNRRVNHHNAEENANIAQRPDNNPVSDIQSLNYESAEENLTIAQRPENIFANDSDSD